MEWNGRRLAALAAPELRSDPALLEDTMQAHLSSYVSLFLLIRAGQERSARAVIDRVLCDCRSAMAAFSGFQTLMKGHQAQTLSGEIEPDEESASLAAESHDERESTLTGW